MKFLFVLSVLWGLMFPAYAQVVVTTKQPCEVRFINNVTPETMDALMTKIDDPAICAPNQRVELTLQTGGGDVDTGMFVYKMLRKRVGGVDTRVEYSTASMGIILLLAGEKRTMSSSGYLLVHELTSSMGGEYERGKLSEFTKGIDIERSDYVDIVADRTGLSKEKVDALMSAHTFLNANEALTLGFVTEISN